MATTKKRPRSKPAAAKKATAKKKAPIRRGRSAAAVGASTRAPRSRGPAVADDGGGNEDKRTIELRGAGPLPRMAIQVTQLQLGEYSVSLWDRNGMNPKEIARSTNDDDIADEFPVVATVSDIPGIDGFTMFWVVWIKALQFGEGARYFVSVTITQGTTEIVRFERQGPMTTKFLPFHGEWAIRVV